MAPIRIAVNADISKLMVIMLVPKAGEFPGAVAVLDTLSITHVSLLRNRSKSRIQREVLLIGFLCDIMILHLPEKLMKGTGAVPVILKGLLVSVSEPVIMITGTGLLLGLRGHHVIVIIVAIIKTRAPAMQNDPH